MRTRALLASVMLAAAIVCGPTVERVDAAVAGGTMSLTFESDPGDPIGGGVSRTFTTTDARFVAETYGVGVGIYETVRVSLTTRDEYWDLQFGAARGRPLEAGPYPDAGGSASPVAPGLRVSGQGRGCNRITGEFTVLEAVLTPQGTVTAFAADFEQHCEGTGPALRGRLRYRADAPFAPATDADGDGVPNTV